MFSVTILGSGSAGNCALVEAGNNGECRVLVDGGLSARQITLRLASVGVDAASLSGILLTHEHSDHVAGLRVLCKKYDLPVYCTRLTAEVLRGSTLAGETCFHQFQPGTDFCIGALGVHPFSVPHDAVDPVGFVLSHGSDSVGFLTDLGHCTQMARERIRGVGTLVIETNHDEKLLQADTRRPWSVKQRILSRHGHLSNAAAGDVLAGLLEHGLRRAVLGHLSRDCNTEELAVNEVRTRLAAAGARETEVEVFCASQTTTSPRFPLSPVSGGETSTPPGPPDRGRF